MGIAVDADDHVYVTDSSTTTVYLCLPVRWSVCDLI